MTYVIKDLHTGHYYTNNVTPRGYYHPDIERARFYTKRVFAQNVMDANSHHVAWPGNRNIVSVPVKITELDPEDIPCPDDCEDRVSNGEAYNCPVCPRVWHADFN